MGHFRFMSLQSFQFMLLEKFYVVRDDFSSMGNGPFPYTQISYSSTRFIATLSSTVSGGGFYLP